jgi:hypothetical protein
MNNKWGLIMFVVGVLIPSPLNYIWSSRDKTAGDSDKTAGDLSEPDDLTFSVSETLYNGSCDESCDDDNGSCDESCDDDNGSCDESCDGDNESCDESCDDDNNGEVKVGNWKLREDNDTGNLLFMKDNVIFREILFY